VAGRRSDDVAAGDLRFAAPLRLEGLSKLTGRWADVFLFN
jgi:hypothetical protein